MKKKSSTAVRRQRGSRATASEPLVSPSTGHRQDGAGASGGSRRHVLTPAPMDPSNWLG
jgi:hypothetical protein